MKKRRAFARGGKARGKKRGMFFGGLFGGGSQAGAGSTSATQSTSNTSTQIDPGGAYYPLEQAVLQGAQGVINRPYEAYDPNQRFADFNADQQGAFQSIRNNQDSWRPYFNQGYGNLSQASGQAGQVGSAGDTAFGMALNAPGAAQSAQPYLQEGTGRWTDPGNAQAYMSPWVDTAAQGITNTASRAFGQQLQNINDTFSGGSAGQFGRTRHGDEVTRVGTGFAEGLTNQLGQLYNQAYQGAQTAFGADQNRQLQAGQTAAGAASQDMSGRTNLGQAQVGAANTGVNAGINAGNALITAGGQQQSMANKDASNLLAIGNQQQTQAQKLADFNYQQWLQKQNWDVNNLQLAQGLGQGWQLPTSSSSQSSTSGMQGTTTPTGSVAGNVLGAATSLAGMSTGKDSTVGGDIWNWATGGGSDSLAQTGNAAAQAAVNAVGPITVKRGGHIKRAFAAGGHAPVVKALRTSYQQRQPAQMQRQQAFQQKQQGPMAGGPPPGGPPGKPPGRPGPAFAKGGKVSAKAAVHKHERNMHKGKAPTKLAGGGKVNGAFSPMPRRGFAYAKGGSHPAPDVDSALLDDMGYQGQFLRSAFPHPSGPGTGRPYREPTPREAAQQAEDERRQNMHWADRADDYLTRMRKDATAFGQRELEGASKWFTDPVNTARKVLPNYLPQNALPIVADFVNDLTVGPATNIIKRYSDPANYTRDPLGAAIETAWDASNYIPEGAFGRWANVARGR